MAKKEKEATEEQRPAKVNTSIGVGSVIVSALLAILVTAGVCAGGFGIGVGAGVLRYGTPAQQAQRLEQARRLEEQQAETEPQLVRSNAGSSLGPNVREEYGTITWLSETWPSNPDRMAAIGASSHEAGETPFHH